MIGTHADAIIASAFVRGIKDFDKELAFKAMYKNAMVSGDTLYEGRKGLKWYKKLGYVPSDKMGYYRKRLGGQATARTLEFAFDDFSIAQFAKGLGKIDEAEYFLKRSMNYRNVFDKKVGFVRGRNSDGSWTHIPFDPMKRHGPFTEATAWHYTWSVQHDIQGLINLIGGNRKFIKKLETALKGGKKTNYVAMPPRPDHQNLYFWFGNEPVHHAVYLFDYAGAPWKTQYWARDIMTRAFSVKPEGLPGDEDTGQMSAWYIFSSLGFYPTCPARPTYDIGSPVFEKVIINLSTNSDNGKKFIITAKNASNENIYIQSANLNGKKLDKPWITHKNIVSGGHLEFEMGPDPNKKWGSDAKNVPPSISEIKK
jgi:predicted alpha-1,2-mannosidase